MKILDKIEILPNGRIQVRTKIMHELKDGSFVAGGNHRLAYNPGEVIGDDGGDDDLVDENGLLQSSLDMIPKKLKVDFLNERISEAKTKGEKKIYENKIKSLR